MTILIADEDRVMTSILRSHLTGKGFQVTTAHSAHEAGSFISRLTPDAAILDFHTPDGVADSVLKQLKNSTHSGHIRVFAVGETWDPEEMERIRAMGANEFLEKPLDLACLDSRLKKMLVRAA